MSEVNVPPRFCQRPAVPEDQARGEGDHDSACPGAVQIRSCGGGAGEPAFSPPGSRPALLYGTVQYRYAPAWAAAAGERCTIRGGRTEGAHARAKSCLSRTVLQTLGGTIEWDIHTEAKILLRQLSVEESHQRRLPYQDTYREEDRSTSTPATATTAL